MIEQARRLQATFAQFRYIQRCRGCVEDGGGAALSDWDCLIAEPHISWRHLLNPGVIDCAKRSFLINFLISKYWYIQTKTKTSVCRDRLGTNISILNKSCLKQTVTLKLALQCSGTGPASVYLSFSQTTPSSCVPNKRRSRRPPTATESHERRWAATASLRRGTSFSLCCTPSLRRGRRRRCCPRSTGRWKLRSLVQVLGWTLSRRRLSSAIIQQRSVHLCTGALTRYRRLVRTTAPLR